ncbi:hypothetical protein EBR96_08450, partial [bacterium]|nr:hypothetical protein [bacterium]
EGVDATFRKQGYKRLMMLFDLWLGAQIVDYIEKLNGHADPVHVTLVLEAGHKIASDCMKQLGGSADHSPDKMLIIAQAEKLTTKLDQCLAPMRGGVAVGSRLPARLDQPLFPFMPLKVHAPIFSSASGSVEPGLPLYSKRRILDWAGIVEVLADTLSWFADLENRASEVRISAATARVEDFALSYLNARDGLASDSVSESVLGSLVKAADSVIKEYLKVCLHREAIRKEVQDPFEYGRRLITAIALFDLVDRAVRANPVIGLVFGNYYFPLVGAINGSAITALTHLILPGSLWQRAAKQVLDIVQENSTGRTALTRTDFSLGILQFVIRRDGDYPPLFERLEFLADSVPEWKEKLADRGPEVLTNIAFRYQELLRAHPAPMIREWMRAVQHAVIVIHNIPSNGTGVNKMHPFEWHTNVNDTQHSVYISGALASVGSRPQPSFLHFVSVNYQKFLNLESVSENKRLTENAVIPSEIGVSAFHHIGLLFSDPVDQRMERLYSHIQDGVFNLEDPHHQYLIRQVLWMANAAEPNAFSRMLTDRPGLYAGFCDLFLACFRKLEMKMMSVNAVAFLAETASVFREFSDPADQGP